MLWLPSAPVVVLAKHLGVSKPDVTAPGVNILAAITPYEAEPIGRSQLMGPSKSGTSMSGPHVAGSAALLTASASRLDTWADQICFDDKCYS